MIYEKKSPIIETYKKRNELDLNLLKKRGNSKTFKGWLISRMKESRDNKQFDVTELIQVIYKKYLEFETSETFKASQWKGKSSITYLEHPDKIIIVKYQKPEPFEQPKEIKVEILIEEINRVLWAIQSLNKGIWLNTSDIAEKVYGKEWKKVFSDRPKHIILTLIFNYLEYKKIIDYKRSGKVFLK
jgi:hypothetical protein